MAGHTVLQTEKAGAPAIVAVDTIIDAPPSLALAQPAGLTLERRTTHVMTGLGILEAAPQDTVRKPRAKAYTYITNTGTASAR